jgi:hypothetical protein
MSAMAFVDVIDLVMSTEADAACNASYGERSEERINSRNGYRARRLDTRVGTKTSGSQGLEPAAISRNGCWAPAPGGEGVHSGDRRLLFSPTSPPGGSTSSSTSPNPEPFRTTHVHISLACLSFRLISRPQDWSRFSEVEHAKKLE